MPSWYGAQLRKITGTTLHLPLRGYGKIMLFSGVGRIFVLSVSVMCDDF
jgi:hypothetical protein